MCFFFKEGASTQFLTVPFNFLSEGETADYINTGAWSTKAIEEAKSFGNVNEAYSSADTNFNHIPTNEQLKLTPQAKYVHFTLTIPFLELSLLMNQKQMV